MCLRIVYETSDFEADNLKNAFPNRPPNWRPKITLAPTAPKLQGLRGSNSAGLLACTVARNWPKMVIVSDAVAEI